MRGAVPLRRLKTAAIYRPGTEKVALDPYPTRFSPASTGDPCPSHPGPFLMLFTNNTLVPLLPAPCLSSGFCQLLRAVGEVGGAWGKPSHAGSSFPLCRTQGSGSLHLLLPVTLAPLPCPLCPPWTGHTFSR